MDVQKIVIPKIQNTVKKTVKLKWHKFNRKDSRKYFAPITVENKKLGNLKLVFEKPEDLRNRCFIKLQNSSSELLGKEIISLQDDMKYIYGYNITVEPKYRKTGIKSKYRFGELLRLGSVITMLKNKYKSIRIYSLNDAVYFHSKYKFEPAIEELNEAQKTLESIIKDTTTSFSDLRKTAQILLSKKPATTDFKQKDLFFGKVNALVKQYIERVLKEGNNGSGHTFDKGFDMILTQDTAYKESKFFNKLFKKHGIDYKI